MVNQSKKKKDLKSLKILITGDEINGSEQAQICDHLKINTVVNT